MILGQNFDTNWVAAPEHYRVPRDPGAYPQGPSGARAYLIFVHFGAPPHYLGL